MSEAKSTQLPPALKTRWFFLHGYNNSFSAWISSIFTASWQVSFFCCPPWVSWSLRVEKVSPIFAAPTVPMPCVFEEYHEITSIFSTGSIRGRVHSCPSGLELGVTWMYSYCRLLFRGQVTLWKFLELERGTFQPRVCLSGGSISPAHLCQREGEVGKGLQVGGGKRVGRKPYILWVFILNICLASLFWEACLCSCPETLLLPTVTAPSFSSIATSVVLTTPCSSVHTEYSRPPQQCKGPLGLG